MKKLLFLLTACCFFPLRADFVIVTGNAPSRYEKIAAEELQEFLPRLSGEKCRIASEQEAKAEEKTIYLGDTAAARSLGLDVTQCGKEEWILRGDGKKIVISGGRPAGTLYGVYAFLEKLGVRFFAWDTVVVPKTEKFAIPALDERKKPDFEGRHIFDYYPIAFRNIKAASALEQWKRHRLRNRFNGSHGGGELRDLYEGDLFRVSPQLPQYHNFYNYLSPKEYFSSHPEYFSMNDAGKRFHGNPQGGNLCLSNPEVAKIVAASLRRIILSDREKNPDAPPLLYDVSQMDQSAYMCRCPECRKISGVEGECGLLLTMINRVAEAIAKEFPEIRIRTFAYSSTVEPPKTIRPAPNVIIQYCDPYMQSDCFRPLASALNHPYREMIRRWKETGAALTVWDYWNMGFASLFDPPRPEVVIDALPGDFRFFRDSGVRGIFIECERSFDSPQNFIDLEYYLAGRLMLDCNADAEAVIDEFLRGYYGAAAPQMKEYLTLLRRGVAAEPRRQVMMAVGNWSFLTPETLLKIHKLLLDAEKAASADPLHSAHVRSERITPLWYTISLHDRTAPVFTASGFPPETLAAELETLVTEGIARCQGKKPEALLKKFEPRFRALTAHLQLPEQFSSVERARVFGWPQLVPEKLSSVRDDDEAGKVIVADRMTDGSYHGEETVRSLPVTGFGFWAPGVCSKSVRLRKLPTDGKFHWYVIPDVKLGSKSIFWAHLWHIKINLASAFLPEDDDPEINRYDLHFAARFRGPAYIPGDTRSNEIAVDRIVLIPKRTKEKK